MPTIRPSAAMKIMSSGMNVFFIQKSCGASAPVNRFDRIAERLRAVAVYFFGQKKFVRPEVASVHETSAGWMHFFIFWGFTILGLQIMTMFGRGYSDRFYLPGFSMRLLGGPYLVLRDLMEAIVLFWIAVAFVRWL